MATSCMMNVTKNESQEITGKALAKFGSHVPVPFQLNLDDQKLPLQCNEVVRIVPGKRLVAFGKLGAQDVVAKLFFESGRAKHHLEREVAGIETLVASGIPTPKLLYQGAVKNGQIRVLLFERIMVSKNLDDIWRLRTDPDELKKLMLGVTLELATQHVLGVVQRDLHLKNILISNRKIYTLDGSDIICEPKTLDKKASLDHLALFFSQLGAGTKNLRHALFQHYAKSRGWLVKKADVVFLNQSLKKWNDLRWRRYQKKIMRNCTAFTKLSHFFSTTVYDKEVESPEFMQLLQNPESAFKQAGAEYLKQGRSATIVKIKVDNKIMVVKRYNIKNIWHRLRRCLRTTRAAMSWQFSHLLRLSGIQTAKPLAFVDKHFMGLRGRSYFIMEYVAGKNIGDYFSDYQAGEPRFTKTAERVMALLDNLAELQISHGDLKKTNIVIKNDHPVLLDLDGMKIHKNRWAGQRACEKDIKRFMKNWENRPDVAILFKNQLPVAK